MRNFTLILVAMLITTIGSAQNAPINFETGGYGASWTWTVFEDDTNPPLTIVSNPASGGINTSATVAKFTALASGQPWADCESAHGSTNLGTFVLDTSNNVIKIKVYKSVISDVGIKLVSDSGWAMTEVKVANTLINQWEELTFSFANHTNPPASQGVYDQIVVFPDFNLSGRGQTNICYFDDITFNTSAQVVTGPTNAAPTPPVRNPAHIISVFSGAYTNLVNTNFNPNWGQSTLVTQTSIQGDDILKYANFNYQGTQFAAAINATSMDNLHVDVWSADSINPNIFCISSGPVEKSFTLTLTPNQWNSFDIPLSTFSSVVNMADIIQFKFDGGTNTQTIYLDNIYFFKDNTGFGDNIQNKPITVYPNPVVAGQAVSLSAKVDEYSLFDLSGKLIHQGNTQSISTSKLSKGLYFIELKDKKGNVSIQKLIVE